MAALSNILPITILGFFCLIVLIVLAYYSWKRAFLRSANTQLENPEYEVEEIPGTTDFVMVGRKGHSKKKVKKPKLWEIWVSSFGERPVHERKLSSGSSLSDLLSSKDVGYWAELKPMNVTYVKNPNKAHIPPIPIPTFIAEPSTVQIPGPTTITVDGSVLMGDLANSSQYSLPQPPSREILPRHTPGPYPTEALALEVAGSSKRQKHESISGYDKSTIEAVQVSILIAMPQRPIPVRRHTTESTGPLELGVANVPLGHSAPRWAARQSIRPPAQ